MRMRVMRLIFFVLIVFLAVPEFAIGVPALWNGLRAHGDVWWIRHDYFSDAAVTLIPGVLALLLAFYGAFRAQRANWVYNLLATGIVLLMAVSIPSFLRLPVQHAASQL